MDETLIPLLREPKAVEVGGKTYTLRMLTVRDVPFVSRLIRDVWNELMARPDLLGNTDALSGWVIMQLPGLLETKIEDLLALLSRQTGESADALGALPLDQFIELASAALEDGLDFFTRQVMPVLTKQLAAHGIGQMSSPSSSPTDTGATTSPATA